MSRMVSGITTWVMRAPFVPSLSACRWDDAEPGASGLVENKADP